MKKKYVWISSSIVVLILLIGINSKTEGFGGEPAMNPVKDHHMTIKKLGNEWKVVFSNDSTKSRITAKRNEKITWSAEGSDVFFQFMSENLFGKFSQKLEDGKTITLTIGEYAKLGIHRYSVFCLGDLEFASGNSPPEIDLVD